MVEVVDLVSSSEDEENKDEDEENKDVPNREVSASHCIDPKTGEYVFSHNHRLPKDLGDMLYSYQREGVGFILSRWHTKPCHGCLLADDMGMGKTLQSVAALTSLFYSFPQTKQFALIIAPLAVLGQWQTAVEKTFSKCELFHGTNKLKALDRVRTAGGVLLSTYDTVSTEHSVDALVNVQWDCLIIDEATKIKNYKTGAFKAARALADRSKHRLALSATPFENNLGEMWALFDFCCAGRLLGKKVDFDRNFSKRIESSSGSSSRENTVLGAKLSRTLHDVIAPFMLRREKSLLKQHTAKLEKAPEFNVNKVDCVVWVSLSPHQRSTYQLFLESEQVKQVLNQTQSPLAAITVLRKICDDTRLLPELNHNPSAGGKTSNKMRVLIALLRDLCLEKEHKTVVFCNSKQMLDFMEAEVDKHLGKQGFSHLRVDGSVKTEDRARYIRAFNRNEPVFTLGSGGEEEEKRWDCLFLTTGVGALGIEITGADRVILFQPHWNPAQDDQAVDRCFRLGQKKNVVCFRLVTVGTVEEKMCDIQLRKSSLARNVLQASKGSSYACKFGIDTLFTLDAEMGDDEWDEVFGPAHQKRNLDEVERLLLSESPHDCAELTSQLEALTSGRGDSSYLVGLFDHHIVLSASERSQLFQENSRELQLGMQALTREERENLNKAMEDALHGCGSGQREEEEEVWVPRLNRT
ncbi:hypothetical protein BASA81_010366 [Batrachochytrium salamandrivorans]|nr:hypothetical protein BASA81_010366 [Batrachochytrium salamandrivorans]